MPSKHLLFTSTLIALLIFSGVAWGKCGPDKNNAPEDAVQIEYGSITTDTLCADDHIDYYRFFVSNPETQGKGVITLTANPGELMFYLYNANVTELFASKTSDGKVKCKLNIDTEMLRIGAYYIAVFLSNARDDENSYTLKLELPGVAGWVVPSSTSQAMPIDIHAAVAPWPNDRCDAARTGRSDFNGPMGEMVELASYDAGLSSSRYGKLVYGGLRVGPSDMVYFFSKDTRVLQAYNVTTGPAWSVATGSTEPPVLDGAGLVYLIDTSQKLACLNHDGTVRWSKAINDPYNINPWTRAHSVMLTGGNIFVNSLWQPGPHITAFKRDGTEAWNEGPFQDTIQSIAEDNDGNLFCKVYQHGLLKMDINGNVLWDEVQAIELPDILGIHLPEKPAGLGNIPLQITPPPDPRLWTEYPGERQPGPICGSDRRVWVSQPEWDETTEQWDISYKVFNTNGSTYLGGEYDHTTSPTAACYGGNGRFYLAEIKGDVTCFAEWDEVVWDFESNDEGEVQDMVMGSDNILYFTMISPGYGDGCVITLYALDPNDNNNILSKRAFNSPGGNCDSQCYLAVGDGKIVWLSSDGFMKVFGTEPLISKVKLNPNKGVIPGIKPNL